MEALAKMSNVAAIESGTRAGDASMRDYMTRFGFGHKTGVERPGNPPKLFIPPFLILRIAAKGFPAFAV
jgi:cell division protein FtsI/penicillin-binding protein 2